MKFQAKECQPLVVGAATGRICRSRCRTARRKTIHSGINSTATVQQTHSLSRHRSRTLTREWKVNIEKGYADALHRCRHGLPLHPAEQNRDEPHSRPKTSEEQSHTSYPSALSPDAPAAARGVGQGRAALPPSNCATPSNNDASISFDTSTRSSADEHRAQHRLTASSVSPVGRGHSHNHPSWRSQPFTHSMRTSHGSFTTPIMTRMPRP